MTQGDSGPGVSEGGVGTSPHSLCSLAHTQGAVLCPARGQVLGAQGWEGLLALRHGNGWGAAHKGGHFYSQRNTLGSMRRRGTPAQPCRLGRLSGKVSALTSFQVDVLGMIKPLCPFRAPSPAWLLGTTRPRLAVPTSGLAPTRLAQAWVQVPPASLWNLVLWCRPVWNFLSLFM